MMENLTWVATMAVQLIIGAFATSIIMQLVPRRAGDPPKVFHWVPFIGNAISYGLDPYQFFTECREKHGDLFTFLLFGKRITCYLGTAGNDFILDGKRQNLNAEDVYRPLTTPVFGTDVLYDCPSAKFIQQKKFVKFGLTQKALEDYVPLIETEVLDYIGSNEAFQGQNGTMDVCAVMSEITIFTAGRSLQGKEVRARLTSDFAALYHDLDQGFQPVNFLFPWVPFPHNRKRDAAHARMRTTYIDIIAARRQGKSQEESDMIGHLMECRYKDGSPIADKEIAHMMISLLMAGQHTSASASSWAVLYLASRPDLAEELYQEQLSNLTVVNDRLLPLQYSDLDKLPLLQNAIKETLRMRPSIHSVMRSVTQPMQVPGTQFVIQPGSTLLASPLVTAMSEEHFPNAHVWDPHRWDTRDAAFDGEEADDSGGLAVGEGGSKGMSRGAKSPYLPFGAGRHRCIGEKFAYVNLGAILATLVRNFRFATLDGQRSVPEIDYSSLISRPQQPATVRWERRYPAGMK